MALEGEATQRGERALAERGCELYDPLVLAHDVTRERVVGDLRGRGVAQ